MVLAGESLECRSGARPGERGVADSREDVAEAADVGRPVVVRVVEVPVLRKVLGRVVPAVGDLVGHRLGRELAGGPGPEDVGEELPARLRLDGRADPDVPAASPEVGLEGVLLGCRQHVAGRVEEGDRAVPRQVGLVDQGGVGGDLQREAAVQPQLAQLLHTGLLRLAVAGGDQDQHLVLRPERLPGAALDVASEEVVAARLVVGAVSAGTSPATRAVAKAAAKRRLMARHFLLGTSQAGCGSMFRDCDPHHSRAPRTVVAPVRPGKAFVGPISNFCQSWDKARGSCRWAAGRGLCPDPEKVSTEIDETSS